MKLSPATFRKTMWVLLPAALLAACAREEIQPVEQDGEEVAAELLQVTVEEIPETYSTTGTLIADDRVEIASRLMGFIRELRVREGSTVKKGDLLLTIDPTEIEARLSEARARLAQAQARVNEIEVDFRRYKRLYEQKLIPASRFQKAELALQVAREELRVAQANLRRVEVQLQYAEIRSPVDGVVVEKRKQTGDIATPGAAILVIENPDNIVLKTFIREDHVSHVQVGDRLVVTVDAARLKTIGTVTQVVPAGDPATHSYLVKATLEDTGQARIGMFARAEFLIGSKWGILIPEEALVRRADLPGVYVVDEQGVAHFRMLRVGRRMDGRVEILAGLRGGERIVLRAATPVHTGDRIVAADGSERDSGSGSLSEGREGPA